MINTRSYGEDPAMVAKLGAAFIRGVQDNGMIATGKHFPGHGDTGVNSHLALPVVTVSRNRLDSVELVPFRAAVNSGVGAIMSFHGAMPALDSSGVPGTLSHKVLTDLLRNELRFKGIIISDAMDMAGVLNQFGAVEAVKRAVAAGVDILIQPLEVIANDRRRRRRCDRRSLHRSATRRIGAANSPSQAGLGARSPQAREPRLVALHRGRQLPSGDGAPDRRKVDNPGEGFDRIGPNRGELQPSSSLDNCRPAQ